MTDSQSEMRVRTRTDLTLELLDLLPLHARGQIRPQALISLSLTNPLISVSAGRPSSGATCATGRPDSASRKPRSTSSFRYFLVRMNDDTTSTLRAVTLAWKSPSNPAWLTIRLSFRACSDQPPPAERPGYADISDSQSQQPQRLLTPSRHNPLSRPPENQASFAGVGSSPGAHTRRSA
jgi:hypothetical protein